MGSHWVIVELPRGSTENHIFRFFNQKFSEIIWQISILFISLGIETNEIN